MSLNHFPVHHKNFKYHPSKNPYWKKIIDLNHPRILADHYSENYSGSWKEKFCPNGRLHVEMGCNGGHWLLGNAQRHPNDFYIGIDYKFKQIYFAYEKSIKHQIENIALLRANIDRLHFVFGNAEIDSLYLFFPDPWQKDAQVKKRTFQEDWLRRLSPLLSANGEFIIKTDHPDYAEHMRAELEKVKDVWEVVSESRDFHGSNQNAKKLSPPDITLFERVFIQQDKPIHYFKLRAISKV